MADHISSIYSAVADVPLIASPQFKLPRQIQLPFVLAPISDDVMHVFKYDFSLERVILAQAAAYNTALASEEAHQAELAKAYEESLMQKRRAEARKIAPGFLDTDRRILTPEPLYSPKITARRDPAGGSDTGSESGASDAESGWDRGTTDIRSSTTPPERELNESPLGRAATRAINFSEFEQGLAPPDPWDTPTDDFKVLQDVLGFAPPNPAPHHSQQLQQQPQAQLNTQGSHYPPQSHSSYPPTSPPAYKHSPMDPPQPRTVYGFPSIPQVPHSTSSRQTYPPLVSSVLTTSISQIPTYLTSPKYNSSPQLPARPPKSEIAPVADSEPEAKHYDEADEEPVVVDRPEVEELMGMGFSREKSLEALKRWDYDVERAANYLVD